MRGFIAALIILSSVGGCGSKTEDAGISQTLVAAIKARKEAKAAEKAAEGKPKAAPTALTRASIAHVKTPFLQIDAQALGVKTFYSQVAQNGNYRTYLNNLKMSVTYNEGIIAATRGFGLDLLSQGSSISPAAMFTDTIVHKFYSRTQQQLAIVKQVAVIDYNCVLVTGDIETITIIEIDYRLTKYTETCRNRDRAFKNFYWVEADTKEIWKSAQSIGQQAGYFITEVLVQ
jgi:hypothetical protein